MNKKAFTLIELLVVVLIIGILAAIALPQYQKAVLRARATEIVLYMSNVSKALDRYILANGYPAEDIYNFPLDIEYPTSLPAILSCGSDYCFIEMHLENPRYVELLFSREHGDPWRGVCTFYESEDPKGKDFCNIFRGYGYSVTDADVEL